MLLLHEACWWYLTIFSTHRLHVDAILDRWWDSIFIVCDWSWNRIKVLTHLGHLWDSVDDFISRILLLIVTSTDFGCSIVLLLLLLIPPSSYIWVLYRAANILIGFFYRDLMNLCDFELGVLWFDIFESIGFSLYIHWILIRLIVTHVATNRWQLLIIVIMQWVFPQFITQLPTILLAIITSLIQIIYPLHQQSFNTLTAQPLQLLMNGIQRRRLSYYQIKFLQLLVFGGLC